jgi:phage shock protein A
MIFGKMWRALRAQFNKLANAFSSADPVAQMQYEYDASVEQLKEGRQGLEQYRALVERVSRQVKGDQTSVANLEAKIRAYLQAGDRESAAKFALDLQKAKAALVENQAQLAMHDEAYGNNLLKIKHAGGKLAAIKEKINKYDADLKMSRAEAELAQLAHSFDFNLTTDFGQIESVLQEKIDLNRSKARVAADLSGEGLHDIRREQTVERSLADQALRDFEIGAGLVTPETTAPAVETKELGPAQTAVESQA